MSLPTLIVFCGLPGTGKTSLSFALSKLLKCAYIRIDTLETAMLRHGVKDSYNAGIIAYGMAYAVAEFSLQMGVSIIIDGVHPVEESRSLGKQLANKTHSKIKFIEVICSDMLEHRRRVENRIADIPQQKIPAWLDVLNRMDEYFVLEEPKLVVDSLLLPDVLLQKMTNYIYS